MSDTETRSVTELEELLDNEIPCCGVGSPSRDCSNAASLRWSNPHAGCKARRPYKCMDCWMALYQKLADTLARQGYLRCASCGHISHSVLAHTDYRPF